MLKRHIGDKAFYKMMLSTALPIMMQNLITNFVALLDNVMVGQLSTAQIGAVTIINNNLIFVFSLCMFGCISSASIFTTQFYGSNDQQGIRDTFRFKIIGSLLLAVAASVLFFFGSDLLINLYLQGEGDPTLAADTLFYGRQYLHIMILGLIPFALTNSYACTLRECGHPTVPMVAGIAATVTNLVFNYILIFGHFGAPAMGVAGAAVATVISRYVELAIVMIWTHKNVDKNPYIQGAYRSFHIPAPLLKQILIKGLPLILNEALFSSGIAFLNQCYSVCGLDVVPALSISTTIYNLTSVLFRSCGTTVGILTGQLLGAGLPDKEVRESNRKQIGLCIAAGVVFAGITMLLANSFPLMFNTTWEVRRLATSLILISALYMPMEAHIMPAYFTLRSGGKTYITFFFDGGAIWLLMLPLAFCLTRFTDLPIIPVYAICNGVEMIKCVISMLLVRSGCWIQNLTVN